MRPAPMNPKVWNLASGIVCSGRPLFVMPQRSFEPQNPSLRVARCPPLRRHAGLHSSNGSVRFFESIIGGGGRMKTKEILRIKGGSVVHTIAPDSLLSQALGVMVDQAIGSLVVTEHGKLAGMVTFREVLKAVHSNNGSTGGLRVNEVMAKPEVIGPDA